MNALGRLMLDNSISNASVLDIGGTINYWEMNLQYLPEGLVGEIDIVNLPPQDSVEKTMGGVTIRSYEGDALTPPYRLDQYDLVHSNSVIEHVGNLKSQALMAHSLVNLGQYYWIQTPAKSFPLEPHFYVPFFAYLPLGLRALLVRNFDLGFHRKRTDWLDSRILCEETRLLNKKEYETIFSDAKIIKEHFFLFVKSYIATNLTNSDTNLDL